VGIDNGSHFKFLGNIVNQFINHNRSMRVQTGVRFIAKQIFRVQGNGTGNGRTLLHAARQLARHFMQRLAQTHSLQAEFHPVVNFGRHHIREHPQRESYIFSHIHRIEQGRTLKQHTNFLSCHFHLLLAILQNILAIVQNFSAIRL